jgi:hypothetical protein
MKETPLYPFGFGLSYTQFRFDGLEVSSPSIAAGESVKVKALVPNTGERDAEEVVQLYIFRSDGESVFGTVIEFCGLFFISIPAAALAGLLFRLPFLAVFFTLYLDEFIRLGIILWYMNSGRWIKPVTKRGREELAVFRKQHVR